jgi:thioredoxin 1
VLPSAAHPSTLREMSQAANIVATPFKGLARPTIAAHRTRTVCPVRAVVDSSQEAFAVDVIEGSSSTPVLVDFHAAWCGPCKLVAPSMVWADKEYDGKLKVVKIDCTDGNKDLMEQYRVYGLPCLLVFKDGELVAGSLREGAITKKGLAEYIEQWTGLC